MSNSIGNILLDRYKLYNNDPKEAEKIFKQRGIEYNKKWAKAVGFFHERINKESEKPISYMAVRQKLVALKEINDLRWFYFHCQKYSKTKDKDGNQNTFNKCFWGALKIK